MPSVTASAASPWLKPSTKRLTAVRNTSSTPPGPIGIAFVRRRFEIAGQPPMFAAVMVTVAANKLLSGLPTDRMPAILAPDDWAVWLGEEPASLERVKACLKTVDDVRWTMTPEQRAKSAKRGKPTISDPAGLF